LIDLSLLAILEWNTLIIELMIDDWIVGSLLGHRIPLLLLYNYLVSVKKFNV